MSIPPRNTVQALAEAPLIQYSSGHTKARASGAGAFTAFVGFHAEQGRDAAFDAACQAAGYPAIEIRHQRQGGSEVKRHWRLGETLTLFPLTSGPVAPSVGASLANGNRRRTAEAGLGVRWTHGERSKLALRAILVPLLAVGYHGIVQLAVRSRMSDALMAALVDHTRVAELADSLVNRSHHPEPVGPWELALTLGPGQETSWGRGETASVVPLASQHPEAIDREYVRAIYLAASSPARPALTAAWAETVAWAAAYAAGETAESGEEIAEDEVPF